MPVRDDERAPDPQPGPPPESAMGGASDFGAHGLHQASAPAMKQEGRAAGADEVPGDAAIERRRAADPAYAGPERRQGRL